MSIAVHRVPINVSPNRPTPTPRVFIHILLHCSHSQFEDPQEHVERHVLVEEGLVLVLLGRLAHVPTPHFRVVVNAVRVKAISLVPYIPAQQTGSFEFVGTRGKKDTMQRLLLCWWPVLDIMMNMVIILLTMRTLKGLVIGPQGTNTTT